MRFLRLQNNSFLLLQNGNKLQLSTVPMLFLNKYEAKNTNFSVKYTDKNTTFNYKYDDKPTTYTDKYN